MLNRILSWDADFYYDKLTKGLSGCEIDTLNDLIEQVCNDMEEPDSLDAYQEFASKAIRHESDGKNLLIGFALGLGGEAGEVLDDIKKREYHGRDIPIEHAAEELGDVLWYVANIANQLGYKLSDIVKMNKEKLTKRYKELYEEEYYGERK